MSVGCTPSLQKSDLIDFRLTAPLGVVKSFGQLTGEGHAFSSNQY